MFADPRVDTDLQKNRLTALRGPVAEASCSLHPLPHPSSMRHFKLGLLSKDGCILSESAFSIHSPRYRFESLIIPWYMRGDELFIGVSGGLSPAQVFRHGMEGENTENDCSSGLRFSSDAFASDAELLETIHNRAHIEKIE